MSDQTPEKIQQPAKSLASVVNFERLLQRAVNVGAMLNRPLNIKDAREHNGNKGKYLVMSVTDLSTGEELKVQTGGVLAMTVLIPVMERNAFPVSCVFYKEPNNDVIFIRDLNEHELQDLTPQ